MTAAAAYDRVLDRLRDAGLTVKACGDDRATVQCPAHDDGNPSLSVRRGPQQVLVHCHAGCEIRDVVAALGIGMSDLFDNPRGAQYGYVDAAGRSVRTVTRTPDKKFSQKVAPGAPSSLYRLPEVVAAVANDEVIYLTEGEKDAEALAFAWGVCATTAPMGANNFGKVDVTPLHAATVVAVVDNDAAGQKWANSVADKLDGVATLKFVRAAEGKDAADHVAAGHGLDDLVLIEVERPVAEQSAIPMALDDAHMAAWLAHEGLADRWCWAGGLGWMHWDGRRWHPRQEEDAREAARQAVIALNKQALDAGESTDRLRALNGLLRAARINALVLLMRGVVSVEAGDFDQQADLLNVGNGVVDLSTGELLPHSPDLRMTRITETNYVPGATHQDWDQALRALDPEVADWMQVRFGQDRDGPPDLG